MLEWNKYTVGICAFLSSLAGACTLLLFWGEGVKTGIVDPYAWLNFKAALVMGLTQNPGYWFLIVHTILLGIIAWYVRKAYRLLKGGWDVKLWQK